ncbi:SURF1 family protein [Nocardioides sp. AE5]|uniref:SURF1 family protein n=1 Tax=Nocardioides sp. AE5 TaxID=2962573 RepID=UPI0028829C51|nr:SURF1 family protein [Nocardioides sp. AE5]MDT0202394.1 SURF1 family protein [Nocardioides sp. AE5]
MAASHLLHPRYWGFHVVGIAALGVAIFLGFWQLGAWQEHRNHEARDMTLVAPEPLDDVLGSDDPFPTSAVGHPVVIEGTWLPESTVFIRDRAYDDQTGFWVVTPLATDQPGNPALLVVRGWSPSVEEAPAPPTGKAHFIGLLQPPEGALGVTDDDPTDDILPQLRLADAIQHVDTDLYGGYAVVATETAEGEWPVGEEAVNDGTAGLASVGIDHLPEASRSTGIRNFFYAVEWWVFGLFAGFIWWRWALDEARRVDSKP